MSITKAAQPLPCPFCNAEADVIKWHGGGASKRAVHCSNDYCEVGPMVTGSTRGRAVAKWNTRDGVPAMERSGE